MEGRTGPPLGVRPRRRLELNRTECRCHLRLPALPTNPYHVEAMGDRNSQADCTFDGLRQPIGQERHATLSAVQTHAGCIW